MAITVVNIGVANAAAPPVSVTVPAGGVPAGALIVVVVCNRTNSAPAGSVTDTAGNTYTAAAGANLNGAAANGYGRIFYAYNVAALVSGNSITFNNTGSTGRTAMSAFYATGIATASDPLVSSATATSTGNSAAPTVTSGVPTAANCLFVGGIAVRTVAATFVQDSTNGAWATPPNTAVNGSSTTGARVFGGSLVVADSSAHTYAPTWTGSDLWAEMIVAFKPPGGGSVGTANGAASASGVGKALRRAIGAIAAHATVAGVLKVFRRGTGTAAGTATVSGVSRAFKRAVGNAAGHATVDGRSPGPVGGGFLPNWSLWLGIGRHL